MNQNELMHYGVLGMKWGRRKNRYISKDSKKLANIRKKRINQMSNQELKDANYRLNMEKQYKDLTKRRNIGKEAVKAFIAVAGTIVAVEAANQTYKRVGKAAIEKIGKKVVKVK